MAMDPAEGGREAPATSKKQVRVVVTGATGQVAYALLPRIAAGEMFGTDTEIDLRLSDIPQMIDDLIRTNGPIFTEEGRAIAQHAAPNVRVVVVGNPCNTNCLIARASAPEIPDDRWTAMTRLDQNRSRSLLAAKAGARVSEVRKLCIWGNHSTTLYPDFTNATVRGKRPVNVVDREWLKSEFVPTVQQRGAAVIAARGASSAFSAAQALVDHVRSLTTRTPRGDWFSAAVVSDGSYDVPRGLIASFPLTSDGGGGYSMVEGIKLNPFARSKLAATIAELEQERDLVRDLLTG